MIIRYLEKYFKFNAIQEDFRKAGLAFTTGGIASMFLQHLISINLAIWLTIIGAFIWACGLFKMKKER